MAADADAIFRQSLFETNLLSRKFGEVKALNAELKRLILEKEKEDPGIQRSNAAATWHSQNNIMQWGGAPMEDVLKMFNQLFTQQAKLIGAKPSVNLEWRFQAWAMVSRDGDYAHVHTHPNAHWSGVYYIDVGKSFPRWKDSGNIEFMDMRGGPGCMTIRGLMFQTRHVFTPKAGLMLTFPGWLPHYVHPFRGKGERIAISCNATITKYDDQETPAVLGVAPSTQRNVRKLTD